MCVIGCFMFLVFLFGVGGVARIAAKEKRNSPPVRVYTGRRPDGSGVRGGIK